MSPGRLWWLLAVLVFLLAYLLVQQRRARYAVRFTNVALLDQVAPRRPAWRRHVAAALFLAMLALMVFAYARPAQDVKVPRERATIMVAIDVSLSMKAADVPPSRMAAAQEAGKRFIDQLPDRFNVGLVAFAGNGTVVNSPTQDHQAVMDSIDQLQLAERTAIGEAVFASLQAIRSFDSNARENPPPSRIVLLSDGDNTVGRSVPEAIQAARTAKVPVSTIAFGTDNGFIENEGRQLPVRVNKETLQLLSDGTGGHAYTAESLSELDKVYQDIGTSIGYRTVKRETTPTWVGFALIFGALAGAASLTWSQRLP
ncbi:MAG: VWA domain-containing protein [Streptosporangiales bacterium]|nr:VWA domain-containing protein [Streptosporangiales bacterium]